MSIKSLLSVGLLSLAATFMLATDVMAQGGRGRGGFGGRGDMFGVASLLQSDEVQKDIELVDSQKEELAAMRDELRDEIRGRMGEMFRGMRDLSEEERQEKWGEIREEMAVIRADVESRLQGVLQPEQFNRLKQIELQQQVRRRGSSALANDKVAEQLGLTAEQQEALRKKAAEVQAELQEKIAALQKEAREKVLTVLTADQRAKLDEMMGTQIELKQPRRGGLGGGGRGGPRGGGRPAGPPAGGDTEL